MTKDNLVPETVNMADWIQSGEGWNALTYHHRTDESILLKLNSESLPSELATAEFELTEAVHGLGVKSPSAMRYVTDGRRFGFISEHLIGKKSYARLLYENPGMIDTLARDMAAATRELHSLQCDTGRFESVAERLRNEADSCPWIKGKIKAIVNSCADSMRPVSTCLHGDMHPGNILRTGKGDFWIDFGRFGYGDPDLDYASQFVLANFTPDPMVRQILHIDAKTYRRFLDLYGHYYYGEEFESAGTQARLRRAICLCLGHAMAKSPTAARIFGSYVKGNDWIAPAIVRLISHFMKLK